MADEEAPTKKAAGITGILTDKHLGVPGYIWFAGFVLVAYLYLKHRKAQAAAAGTATSQGLPIGASSTDINSASQLANTLFAAGVMPYQGGDVFVNGSATQNPSTPTPLYNTTTQVVDVTRGESVGQLVTDMQKYDPGFSWADFWALNPNIVSQGGLTHGSDGDWTFTAEATPVIVTKPGLISNPYTTRTSGAINGVSSNTPIQNAYPTPAQRK